MLKGVRQRADRTAHILAVVRDRVPLLPRVTDQLLRVNLLDNGTRIAAQVFLCAVPALFVFSAFAPASVRNELTASLRTELGIGGRPISQVQQVLQASDNDTREAFGAVGTVVTLLSATACSRALQRVCERAWRLPRSGFRVSAWRWLVWLLVWLVVLVGQGSLRNAFGIGPVLGLPLAALVSVALWWWTQHLLLGGRVPWRPLLPGALLCTASVLLLSWAARLYMPRALDRSLLQFGPYGAVFTTLSWLIVLGAAVTGSIALGYVLATEEPVRRLLARLGLPWWHRTERRDPE
ncbi:YhjD/YihY/BrkB family envelope integrity protein [Peterkaempfera sp. SMS 1(5)a]|uniref:YhjD/YihY/BrkB family envelope integrity protein n=1 Tax=Peterkaempfera podocarpi TaxID=3232308 RepID=UPI003671678E